MAVRYLPTVNDTLVISRKIRTMRIITGSVVALTALLILDWFYFGGAYGRATSQVFSHIAGHFY